MNNVFLKKQPIELYKLLKFEGLVASGGEAKLMISQGQVLLNGEVEQQKSKKIIAGDTVQYAGETLNICLADEA